VLSKSGAASTAKIGPRRIVIATIGSLGDLHPCLALAVELRQRGHRVTVASTEYYKHLVEPLGIEFQSMRPNWDPNDRALISQCEDLKRGPEVLFRRLILPHLRATHDDLQSVAAGAELLIAGELTYAAPLVAEQLSLPWVSVILSPCSFFSSHDPSVLVNVPSLIKLRKLGTPIYRAALDLARMATRHWWNPVRDLRRELGLRTHCDPLFRDKFSPDLVLALFSRWLAQSQPDWPAQTVQAGFINFYQQKPGCDDAPELTAFLNSGDPPVVFTLGSTAVNNPGDFYQASEKAARKLGRRAVLLGANAVPSAPDVLSLPYAAYSQIFPHAAVIVHQGGSGTTGQALRTGRPMLIVPYGWDQPDNGARVELRGAGLCLSRKSYSAETAAGALERLLSDPRFATRAAEASKQIQKENALALACHAIEAIG
jgi:rhamnosyltransferase subunit B